MSVNVRLFIIIAIVLLPVILTELPIITKPESATGQPVISKTRVRRIAPERFARKPFRLNQVSLVQREAFLASFARQSAETLMPCLRLQMGVVGSIALMARLSQSGSLTGIRVIEPRTAPRECILPALQAMDFSSIGKHLKSETVEIAWRFDW